MLHTCMKNHTRKAFQSIGHISLSISGRYSNYNDIIWHRFRDITTYTVYLTSCDLEKSFIYEKIVEITSHVRCLIHV